MFERVGTRPTSRLVRTRHDAAAADGRAHARSPAVNVVADAGDLAQTRQRLGEHQPDVLVLALRQLVRHALRLGMLAA